MSDRLDYGDPSDRGVTAPSEAVRFPPPTTRRHLPPAVHDDTPPASAEHRARIIERVAAERGWASARASRRVHRPCRRCGAEPAQWCRRSTRQDRQLGFVHPERDTPDTPDR